MIMAEEIGSSFLHVVIHSSNQLFKKHSLSAEISTKKSTKFLSKNSQSHKGLEAGGPMRSRQL